MMTDHNIQDNFANLPYLCPRSRTPLQIKVDSLCSNDGKHIYPLNHGIPIFLRYLPAESTESHTTLLQLKEYAQIIGCEEALKQVYANDPDFIEYVSSHKRSVFLDIIPFTSSSKVLEIGSGLGQVTKLIAPRVQEVYGLEVVEEQAWFAAERCRQLGINNVQMACGGDDCTLPYQDKTFDIVVLNLVFEWCGTRSLHEPHLTSQLRLLTEMHRVLSPGGVLYLSTKNRFALKYLLGKADEHAYNLPFGNALPRWLLNWWLKSKGKNRPQGFLHSYAQLKQMLLTCNFENIQSFWAVPEIRYPDRLISTETETIRAARMAGGFQQGDMRSVKLLMPWIPNSLVKYVTPGLTFLATKSCKI